METKVIDFERDWEVIKESQLSFLIEGISPESQEDPREAVLRALVNIASFN